jgi:hypothetical protein
VFLRTLYNQAADYTVVHMEGSPIRPGEIATSLNRTQTKKAVRRRASNELRTIADREQIASDRVLEMAIMSFERWNSRYGKIYYKPSDQLEYDLIQIVARAIRDEVAELPVLLRWSALNHVRGSILQRSTVFLRCSQTRSRKW